MIRVEGEYQLGSKPKESAPTVFTSIPASANANLMAFE